MNIIELFINICKIITAILIYMALLIMFIAGVIFVYAFGGIIGVIIFISVIVALIFGTKTDTDTHFHFWYL
jgi:hypothetical protein